MFFQLMLHRILDPMSFQLDVKLENVSYMKEKLDVVSWYSTIAGIILIIIHLFFKQYILNYMHILSILELVALVSFLISKIWSYFIK